MKKVLFIFLIFLLMSQICYADQYVFLVDKADNTVSDILSYTSANESTLLGIAGKSYDVVVKELTNEQLDIEYKLYDGNTIVVDQVAVDAEIALQSDINNINKLEKSAFIVILDYINQLEAGTYTANEVQFRNDVMAEYNKSDGDHFGVK